MKVVVVEDQALFREFLVELVSQTLSHEVVGIADNGPQALELIRKTRPDLIILDILIPKLSGILVAQAIKEEKIPSKILALSAETDSKTILQVSQMRVLGFLDKKDASIDVLKEAIQQVGQGKRYYSESLKKKIFQLKSDSNGFQKILSAREQEVLTHVGAGLSDTEIADILGLTPSSAQTHRSNLMRKLDIHTTPELIRFANEQGFWKVAFSKMDLSDTYHLHE